MQFISMDLIGEFYPPSRQGHRYVLTVICLLSFVICQLYRHIYVMYTVSLEVVRKFYLITALSSRTNCLRKLQVN